MVSIEKLSIRHSQDFSSNALNDLIQMVRGGMVSQNYIRAYFGIDESVVEDMVNDITQAPYDVWRDNMIQTCNTEATDMQLHNECLVELLTLMSGDHPAFGNVLGEVYMLCEETGKTPSQAAFDIMHECPEYRRPILR